MGGGKPLIFNLLVRGSLFLCPFSLVSAHFAQKCCCNLVLCFEPHKYHQILKEHQENQAFGIKHNCLSSCVQQAVLVGGGKVNTSSDWQILKSVLLLPKRCSSFPHTYTDMITGREPGQRDFFSHVISLEILCH